MSRFLGALVVLVVFMSQIAWKYRDRLCCLDCPASYLQSVSVVDSSPKKISFEVFDGSTNLIRTLRYGDVVDLSGGSYVRSAIETGVGRRRVSDLCSLLQGWYCDVNGWTVLHVQSTHPVIGDTWTNSLVTCGPVGSCGYWIDGVLQRGSVKRIAITNGFLDVTVYGCLLTNISSWVWESSGGFGYFVPGYEGCSGPCWLGWWEPKPAGTLNEFVFFRDDTGHITSTLGTVRFLVGETVYPPPGQFFPGGASSSTVWHNVYVTLN